LFLTEQGYRYEILYGDEVAQYQPTTLDLTGFTQKCNEPTRREEPRKLTSGHREDNDW
jgi:hypothetical protein